MHAIKARFFTVILFYLIFISSCTLKDSALLSADDIRFTQSAKTIEAQLTQVQQPVAVTQTFVAEGTSTPQPTIILVTPSPDGEICDQGKFVEDVTVPDNSIFTIGSEFTKIWRIQNIGSCTWTTEYDVVFISGNGMSAEGSYKLPAGVIPGDSIDIPIEFKAPLVSGDYKGSWQLRNPDGKIFGLGSNADLSFWVDIQVIEPNTNYKLDFALSYCTADWSSSSVQDLTCPSDRESQDGSVNLSINPKLENRTENEPAILVIPENILDGWIRGVFPAIKIVNGDRFIARIGCIADSSGCELNFILQVEAEDGSIASLGEWAEILDGSTTVIDIDLSGLAGGTYKFILITEVTGGNVDNSNGFWFVPHVD